LRIQAVKQTFKEIFQNCSYDDSAKEMKKKGK